MDSMESLDSGMQMDKVLTDNAQEYLLTACKWSKFLAIVGFVSMGFVILGLIGVLVLTGLSGSRGGLFSEFGRGGGILLSLLYIAIFAMYFIPLKYLYSFATKTKQGIETSSTVTITEGIQNLKSFFKFFGIFTAVILGVYLLMILIGIVFGALG